MRRIGIVCEGPTDYLVLKEVVDAIMGEENGYYQLQPEADLEGRRGNGWRGVWKWCADHGKILNSFMKGAEPRLDLIIVQMDGDVSRKDKEVHCFCETVECNQKPEKDPLICKTAKEGMCPVELPCSSHEASVKGYRQHLDYLITQWLENTDNVCIIIPCDSTDTWVLAAYEGEERDEALECIEDPWTNIISKGKCYHDIRIRKHRKNTVAYMQFAEQVGKRWELVKRCCESAEDFEKDILSKLSCSKQDV